MKFVRMNKSIVNETLAAPIYAQNGVVFMNRGSVFTDRTVDILERIGINTVYIEDNNDDVNVQELIDAPIRFRILRKLKDIFEKVKKDRKIDEKEVNSLVDEIIGNLNLSENAFLYNNVNISDELVKLCIHSLDVATLSLVMGISKKYDRKKLLSLGIGALLHDIGKLFDSGKNHAEIGYEFIKRTNMFPTTAYVCIFQHHENEDGSGYPLGLKGDKIYEFSKIVSICNEYINLLGSSDKVLPNEIIEIITAKAINKFNQDIYKEFIQSIYCYPNGLPVRLSNGIDGIVVMQNRNFPSRPVVGIYNEDTPEFYNLMDHLTVFIERVNL